MPNIFIHEKIAYNIAKKLNYLDTPDFYLGALSPDAVNVLGFAKKEERWTSHMRDKNLSLWRNNIYNFYHEEKNNYPSTFIDGYIIHILTDIVFDDYFYNDIVKSIINDQKNTKDAHSLLQKYMNEYAIKNKDNQEINYIKEKLNQAKSIKIKNISKEKLTTWKNQQLIYETSSLKSNPYITDNLIEKLTNIVQEEYVNIVNKYFT